MSLLLLLCINVSIFLLYPKIIVYLLCTLLYEVVWMYPGILMQCFSIFHLVEKFIENQAEFEMYKDLNYIAEWPGGTPEAYTDLP